MSDQQAGKNRVVVLTGPFLWHKNTCATLIERGVNVVGICVCSQVTGGLPLKYIWRSFKRRPALKVIGQIVGRCVYLAFNKRKDNTIFRRLFDEERIRKVLGQWNGATHHTDSYSNPQTREWLESMEADIFIVHSGYWVGKRVREIPRKKAVIGGHPGLTPNYRGSHSAFWAIYKNRPEDVGCSVFWLDAGVDTGDLVTQERIPIEEGDSYFTLCWKGMVRIAEIQAQVACELDNGTPIPRTPHKEIPPDSEFDVPTLMEYIRYRLRQKQVR